MDPPSGLLSIQGSIVFSTFKIPICGEGFRAFLCVLRTRRGNVLFFYEERMKKPEVLVVYKQSTLSEYRSSGHGVRLRRLRAGGAPLADRLQLRHDRYHRAVDRVRRHLERSGFRVHPVFRGRLFRVRGMDRRFRLVVSVGGDGTFLEAARRLARTPILGVNSDPGISVGRLAAADLDSFPRVLEEFLSGRCPARPLTRLGIRLNGRSVRTPVLNEILVSAAVPAETSRYRLKVWGRTEEQLSSGVWIAAPAGTSAAHRSAGGRVLPLFSRRFAFTVREPYRGKPARPTLLRGVLGARETVEVISLMREGAVFADGPRVRFRFRLGDRLEAGLWAPPLWVVGLSQ